MKKLSTLKQNLTISYSILSIIMGYLLSLKYDSFGFLIPIVIANMLAFYFICYMKNGINWKGLCIYFAALFVSFSFLFSITFPYQINELRQLCIEQLSAMYVIIGILAGGIARYKVEREENKKKKEA